MEGPALYVPPLRRSNIRMQYGLTDTSLTCALEAGEFDTAEKIILTSTEPDYLDEGPFDRIPLAIVLNNDPIFRLHPRNLRLARLLVERGADPNLRTPMAEMQRSKPSPMEYLVKFCEDCMESSDLKDSIEEYEFCYDVIGFHNENSLTTVQLKEQLLDLLEIFLAHGGDPNVTSTSALSTVYHMVLRNPEPCMELVLRLCIAGGDLNRCNAHRTTPLMDLVTYAELDTAMDILASILEINPDISSLNTLNCCRHSAVWRAMLSGSPQVAMELLKKGADLAPRALVSQGGWYRCGKYSRSPTADLPWTVSAVFAPLLGNSAPYIHFGCVTNSPREFIPEDLYEFNIDLFNKVMAYSIYPVIDNTEGIFACEATAALQLEFEKILVSQTRFSMEQLESVLLKAEDVSLTMFGNLKAGLQQMCVRQILRQILSNSGKFYQSIQNIKNKGEKAVEKEEYNLDHWTLVQELTPAFIVCLVTEHLKLPSIFINNFMIDAARYQIGACLFILETVECFQACDGESDEGSIDPSLESNFEDEREGDDDERSSWLSASSVYEIDSGTFEGWVSKLQMDGCSSSSDSQEETTSSEDDYDEDDVKANNSDKSVTDNGKQVPDLIKEKLSLSESDSSSSGASIPHSICRDEYEKFSDEFVNSDVSPGNITAVDDDKVNSE